MFYLTDTEWLNCFLQEIWSVVIFIHNLHQDPEATLRRHNRFQVQQKYTGELITSAYS